MLGAWSVNPRHAVVWGWVSDVAIWPAQTPSKGLSRSICRSPKAGVAGSNPAGGTTFDLAIQGNAGWSTYPLPMPLSFAVPETVSCRDVPSPAPTAVAVAWAKTGVARGSAGKPGGPWLV